MRAISIFSLVLLSTMVSAKTFNLNLSVKGEVAVEYVETEEACFKTFDPQWDDEDTRGVRAIFSNESFRKTVTKLESLRKTGYQFAGYKDGESCGMKRVNEELQFDVTFPAVVNSNGEEYFPVFSKSTTLANFASKQNGFKKVTRVYVAGAEEFVKAAEKAARKELSEVLNSVK